ncbi:MAG: T9SS type A sorting domain-containing protein [Sphaerochaetaceae bacterium]
MKQTLLALIALLLVVSLNASMYVLNTISQTVSKINLEDGSVDNSFAVTGLYPNQLSITEDYLYVVNSGDNDVQKIDLKNGQTIQRIDVEEYSNPYSIVIADGFAYVSGLMTNKVYKIDLNIDKVVDELEVGIAPGNLYIYDKQLYVINTGFQYPDYFQGSFSVIDLENFTITKSVDTELNPNDITEDDQGRLNVVCSGDYSDVNGSVTVYDRESLDVIKKLNFNAFLTNIEYANGQVYVGDAFGGGVFVYDAESFEIIHQEDNLFSQGGSALSSYQGNLYIADAGDFMSNSTIRVYNNKNELVTSYQTAIGAVSFAFSVDSSTSVEKLVVVENPIKAYPNPFKSSISIEYDSIERGVGEMATVEVYNLKGQLIRQLPANQPNVSWDGKDSTGRAASNGIYYLKISDDNGIITSKRITLIK